MRRVRHTMTRTHTAPYMAPLVVLALASTPGCLLVDVDISAFCEPECGDMKCGRDPVCGESCGSCDGNCIDGACFARFRPEFVSIELDPEVLRPGEDLTVTAVVLKTGPMNTITGELRDAASFSTMERYGTFDEVGEDTYTQTVTWERMREVREIGIVRGGERRTFTLTFTDFSGSSNTEILLVDIQCEDPDLAICMGECTALPEGARTCDG